MNALKKAGLVLALVLVGILAKAQTIVEPSVTEEDLLVESWWIKPLDQKYKWAFFNLTEAKYNYDSEQTSFLNYSVVGYNLYKGIGPAVGTRFLANEASALAGVQYYFQNPKVLIYTIFTSDIKSDPILELYTLWQYRPEINDKLKFFSQLSTTTNYRNGDHEFGFQRVRAGLDWGLFQAGLALNMTQIGSDWDNDVAPGIFVRLEFQ